MSLKWYLKPFVHNSKDTILNLYTCKLKETGLLLIVGEMFRSLPSVKYFFRQSNFLGINTDKKEMVSSAKSLVRTVGKVQAQLCSSS